MFSQVRSLSPSVLLPRYRAGLTRPTDVIMDLLRRVREHNDGAIWTSMLPEERVLDIARELEAHPDPGSLPLYGLPFSIKDNIDLHGLPTTCGHPGYDRWPERSATVVEQAMRAGAIPIGKNSLDQFATGLSGMRVATDPCRNPIRADLVPGGSSSGSAVAVAAGLVSFSLGTDTGGSGRIPAGMNNIVGIKPTLGVLSNQGLVYNSRFLDTVSIFAADIASGKSIYEVLVKVAGGGRGIHLPRRDPDCHPDELSPQASFDFAVPEPGALEFFGDGGAEAAYADALQLLRGMGGRSHPIDFRLFRESADIPFKSGMLAERYFNYGEMLHRQDGGSHPALLSILADAEKIGVRDFLESLYAMLNQRVAIRSLLAPYRCLVVPTVPRAFTREELEQDSIGTNHRIGYYSYFVSPLDLAAVSVPCALRADGVPAGITLIGLPGQDFLLLDLANRFSQMVGLAPGVDVLG
jgi:allophanate hydrolase